MPTLLGILSEVVIVATMFLDGDDDDGVVVEIAADPVFAASATVSAVGMPGVGRSRTLFHPHRHCGPFPQFQVLLLLLPQPVHPSDSTVLNCSKRLLTMKNSGNSAE